MTDSEARRDRKWESWIATADERAKEKHRAKFARLLVWDDIILVCLDICVQYACGKVFRTRRLGIQALLCSFVYALYI